MATPISIVAQNGMDEFYQNYRAPTDFFVLEDFIFHVGAALGDFYRQMFETRRNELRQEKQDAVVSFSHDWLLELIADVNRDSSEPYITLTGPIMSFPYDKQDTGIQEVLPVKPFGVELERSNVTEIWQYKLLPNTNRIFWRLEIDKIKFFNKGDCNIQRVRVLYVPGISDKMLVPDGLVKYGIDTAIMSMVEKAQGKVVKKTNDNNPNKVMETEINTGAMQKA